VISLTSPPIHATLVASRTRAVTDRGTSPTVAEHDAMQTLSTESKQGSDAEFVDRRLTSLLLFFPLIT